MATKKTTEAPKKASKKKIEESVIEAIADVIQEVVEVPEQVHIWTDGDNIDKVAYEMTGSYNKTDKLLAYSGLTIYELKPGAILKWRV